MNAFRLILACTFAFAIAGHPQAGHSQPVTLSLSLSDPAAHPQHVAALQFARRVEERTQGRVKIEVYPASQLGSTNEVLQKIRLGSIDMAAPSLAYLVRYEKTFAITIMPYLFDSDEHARRVLDGPALNWFAPLAAKQGFVLLSNWTGEFRNMTNSKRPINKPEDIRGLKMRVVPADEFENTMEALGAEGSKIGFSELYLALSKGAVDGQENPVTTIYYNKLYEVQKHLALTQHVYYSTLHLVSARTWAKLTPAQQEILREESKAAGAAMRRKTADEEPALIAGMINAGVKVTRPDLQPFRAATQPARRKFAQFAGEENVRQFLKMVGDERKP